MHMKRWVTKWCFKTSFATRNSKPVASKRWPNHVLKMVFMHNSRKFIHLQQSLIWALGLATYSWGTSAWAEECLLPQEHLRSVDCQIEAGAQSHDWGSLVIRYENERVYFFQTHASTFLMSQQDAQRLAHPSTPHDQHESWGEAEGYDLNASKHITVKQTEAAWACYAQTTGNTAICIPY